LRRIRLLRSSIIAVSLAVLLLGCADDRTAPLRGPDESSIAFVNGGACKAVSDPNLPDDAGCVTTVTKGGEKLSVYAQVSSNHRPVAWRIRLSRAGGQIDQPLRAGNDYAYPRAIGGSDVDLDGDKEWWVKVRDYTSHGAPWSGLNLFVREGSSLRPVMWGGDPLVVNFGGISRLGEGAECREGDLVLLRAEARDRHNTRWLISERRFSLRESRARLVDRAEGLLIIENRNDPKLDPYFQVNCYGSTFTPFS
jgi:hypothetical protein